MISRSEYRALALDGIQDFEVLSKHPVFPDGTQLPVLHAKRYIWMINALLLGLQASGCFIPCSENGSNKKAATVVSIGCFPGSLDRIIKILFRDNIHIIGVGLSISDEFSRAFLGKVYDKLMSLELDPLYHANLSSKYPISIDMEDSSADVVIAGEIFEHLYSPLNFLKEASRVLKKDGHLILTTPNISYIGNIVKLIRGHSCHENLDTSHIYMNSEWRAHIRVYDRNEVSLLCKRNAISELVTQFIDNGEDKFYSNAKIRMKMKLLKLFYIIPRYRNNLCQIFRKD
ncbi:MAG: class I SAM-dependent methyltransferase [Lentisphaerota bacterium]